MKTASLSFAATVTFLSSSIAPGPAFAGDDHENKAEIGGHWIADSYTIQVVPNEAVVDTDTLMRAAENAAESWNQTGLGPQIVVVPAQAGVKGGFAFDHVNTLSIVTSEWPANHQFAGLTQRAVEGETIIETDSIINAVDWQFCNGDEKHAIDLQSVLTHELGHTLGLLDDHDHDQATMFYGSKDDDTSKRSLSPLDVSALEQTYHGITLLSTHPAAAGCNSTSTSTFAPAALVLIVLVARRRRAKRG